MALGLAINWPLFVQISSKIGNFVFSSKMLNFAISFVFRPKRISFVPSYEYENTFATIFIAADSVITCTMQQAGNKELECSDTDAVA